MPQPDAEVDVAGFACGAVSDRSVHQHYADWDEASFRSAPKALGKALYARERTGLLAIGNGITIAFEEVLQYPLIQYNHGL